MDDRTILLQRLGWSQDLIDRCLQHPDYMDMPVTYDSPGYTLNSYESDASTVTITTNVSIITDGSNLKSM